MPELLSSVGTNKGGVVDASLGCGATVESLPEKGAGKTFEHISGVSILT